MRSVEEPCDRPLAACLRKQHCARMRRGWGQRCRTVAVAGFVLAAVAAVGACGLSRSQQTPPRAPAPAADEPHGPHFLGAPRGPWGAVVFREIHLAGARFVLARASLCRTTPRADRDRDVLLAHNVERARCRVRPYHGDIALWFTDAHGERHLGPTLATDRSGELRIEYAELDRELQRARLPALDDMVALELGRSGWAGRYDLRRLRGVLANYYFRWVQTGRATPQLFAARHPDHPNAPDATAFAVEEDLARQESDFRRVQRGELPADAFLERYVWSPLRHSAAMLLPERRGLPRAEQGSVTEPTSSAQGYDDQGVGGTSPASGGRMKVGASGGAGP